MGCADVDPLVAIGLSELLPTPPPVALPADNEIDPSLVPRPSRLLAVEDLLWLFLDTNGSSTRLLPETEGWLTCCFWSEGDVAGPVPDPDPDTDPLDEPSSSSSTSGTAPARPEE